MKITGPLDNGIEIIYRAEDITSFHLSQLRLKQADLIIKPEVRNLSWADFKSVKKIIYEGELAALELLSDIKVVSSKGSFVYGIKKFFNEIQRPG